MPNEAVRAFNLAVAVRRLLYAVPSKDGDSGQAVLAVRGQPGTGPDRLQIWAEG